MSPHVIEFQDKLLGIFERKAAEFRRYAEEQPTTSTIASQLAAMYQDLAELMRH